MKFFKFWRLNKDQENVSWVLRTGNEIISYKNWYFHFSKNY